MTDEDPMNSSRNRDRDHVESVQRMLGDVGLLDEDKYPVTAEELAVEYGDRDVEVPGLTMTVNDLLDRLFDDEYDSPGDVVEAVERELESELKAENANRAVEGTEFEGEEEWETNESAEEAAEAEAKAAEETESEADSSERETE